MQTPLNPVHAVLLAGTVPLFLGALLADAAYGATYEVQWKNFASWLLVGALVFNGFALLWAVAGMFRVGRGARNAIYALLLLAMFVLGFINALVHAGDAWASMPAGLVLSAVVTVLATIAAGLGLTISRPRAPQ